MGLVMSTRWDARVWPWLVAALVGAGGCAVLQGPPKKAEATSPAEEEETEEQGVKGISQTLRRFNRALEAKSFDEAAKLLRRAELSVQKATELTRSHPEFEDTEEAVGRARTRLEVAVEKDRIERRNAAIADLINRGNAVVQQTDQALVALRDRVPAPQDLEVIKTIVLQLAELKEQGRDLLDDARYRQHAEERDAKAAALAERQRVGEWQIAASRELGEPIEEARQSIAAGQKAASSEGQAAAYRVAAQAFARCGATFAQLAAHAGFEGTRLVHTSFGTLTADDTRRQCSEREARLRSEVDKLSWQALGAAIVTQVKQAMERRAAAKTPEESLLASEAVVAAASACQSGIDQSSKMPGYDARATFESPFGAVTATQLRRECAKLQSDMTRDRPALMWRASAQGLVPAAGQLQQRLSAAQSATKATERLEGWMAAKAAASACAEQAGTVAKKREADAKFVLATPLGQLTVTGLREECDRQGQLAEQQIAAAQRAVELEKFLASTRADEVEVARREGIPSRIDKVEGGRVFVYETPGAKGGAPAAKRYGFDTEGRRFDFGAAWLQKAQKIVTDVSAALGAVRSATNGEAMLTAVQAAMPVLESCAVVLPTTRRHPGFDPERQFETPLGKHYTYDLAKACSAEREKLDQSLNGIRWRIELEKVRDRAAEADAKLKGSSSAKNADERLALVSASIGGFQECMERSDAIANAPGADAKLEIASPFGPVSRRTLASACKAQLALARKAVDKATAAKQLEEFIAGTRGDEKEVAEREGVPTRVEKLGSGRVFVYVIPGKSKKSKGEEKRFAFDGRGKRVAEELLRGETPKLETLPPTKPAPGTKPATPAKR